GIDAPAADGTAADGAGADGAGAGMQKNSVVTPAPAPVEVPLTAVPTIDTPPPISFPPSPPATAPAIAPAVPPPAKPDRVLHARRPDPKPRSVARAGHPGPDWRTASPRINETTPYSSDGDPPLWRRWTPRWSEEQSQRGYYVDRYGMPLYPPGH
ncbi:MAG: hypothetical protein M3N26_01735, partial [Pseudomonadota bacterium]|nr:hypothetical protein [Pseudomonadota bacterium]